MLNRINLLKNSNIPFIQSPLKSKWAISSILQMLRHAMKECTPLFFIVSLLLLNAPSSHEQTPLGHWANLDLFHRLRLESLNHSTANQEIFELQRNFLTNQKIDDKTLIEEFRSSGLTHLLALSGGQTAPATQMTCSILMTFILFLLRSSRFYNASSWLNPLRVVSFLIQATVTVFLVGLFQSTGALTRVLSMQLTLSFHASNVFSVTSKSRTWHIPYAVILCLPWIFGFLLHKNPSYDLSFLLSALGALSSRSIGQVVQDFLLQGSNSTNINKQKFSALKRWLQHGWILDFSAWCIGTAITSASMCLLTWPLWPPGHVIEKIMANILAGPCVLFLTTPATLGVYFSLVLDSKLLFRCSHDGLEFSLKILIAIARTFSQSQMAEHQGFPAVSALLRQSKSSLPNQSSIAGLNCEIIALTFLLACFKHRKNRRCQSQMSTPWLTPT